jgi:hypothetical protein
VNGKSDEFLTEWHRIVSEKDLVALGTMLALEFTVYVGDLELQGIDLISLDDRSGIQNLDVLMRPINAVISLREAITPRIAAYLAKRNEDAG